MKHTLTGREERTFMKLIVRRSDDRVVAAHMVGPDAGELIQGIAVAIVAGATKRDFDATVGIHPTAEELSPCAPPIREDPLLMNPAAVGIDGCSEAGGSGVGARRGTYALHP